MADLKKLYDAILTGNAPEAQSVTNEAIAEGIDPQELVTGYMIPAMDEVGRRFENNEYFVPELLIAARAMKQALGILKPLLAESGVEPAGRVAIGTVSGDLHDIGKNLVAAMLEGGGFEVIDLGVDVGSDKFAETVKTNDVHIVALSALLTTTMPAMKKTIEELKNQGLRDKVKVMIGGAPITQDYCDEIGADGYSDNASAAVTLARRLVGA
jgi:5-methyltetrahydrofolate--homocysteine methyltransferase